MAVRDDGTVWAWGSNTNSELGTTTGSDCGWACSLVPLQVLSLNGANTVAAGWRQNVVARADGTLWAWGENTHGQVGDGTTIERTTPVQVSGVSELTRVAAGYDHSLGLLPWSNLQVQQPWGTCLGRTRCSTPGSTSTTERTA